MKTKRELESNSATLSRKRCKKMLRSKNSGNKAFVTFFNSTARLIDVIWINFEGDFTSYTPNGLNPGKRIDLHTYEEHPWIFRDRSSGDQLVFCSRNGQHEEVYFPEPWDGSLDYRAPTVNVILPVYGLKERCLQVIRMLVKKEDVSALGSEIPRSLQEDLVCPKPHQISWEAGHEEMDEEE
ncbi:von Hippel-Lindau disease tumor suppressor-like [Amphiura filiformis]|uniref:von Hippel-Lindau disease tumor suppressor-like n=1 Tax=Amphiura filiformis TaxID=82378 RepID=UPI003B21D115